MNVCLDNLCVIIDEAIAVYKRMQHCRLQSHNSVLDNYDSV